MFQSALNGPYRNNIALSLSLICHYIATNGVLASPAGRAHPIYAPPPPVVSPCSASPAILYSAAASSNAVLGLALFELGATASSPPVAVAKALPTPPIPVMLPANGVSTGPFVPSAAFEETKQETSTHVELRVAASSSATATKEWGVTVTEGVDSYIRQSPTRSPDGNGGQGATCSAMVCKDYMNTSCARRFGGCWDECLENRKYLPPDCEEQTAPATGPSTATPTTAPTATVAPMTAA